MGIYKVKGSPHYHFAFTVKGIRYRGSTRTDKKTDAETIYGNERRRVLLGESDLDLMTIDQAFAKYEEEHAAFLSSYEAIQAHVNSLLAYFGKNKPLHEIGQNDLEKFVAKARGEFYTRKDGGKKYPISNATINRRLSAFQGMHGKATNSWKAKTQRIDFRALKLKERTVRDNTLSRDDAKTLYDAAPHHIKRFIVISLHTGWRKANVLGLTGKQIDLERKIITTIGKGGKHIVSSITDGFERYILEEGLHEAKRVCEFDGQPVRDIKTAWRALFRRTGIKYIRPHDLRHTFGTWLYESTGDQRLVQETLHHSDIKTSQRYTHTKLDLQRVRISAAMNFDFVPELPKQKPRKRKAS